MCCSQKPPCIYTLAKTTFWGLLIIWSWTFYRSRSRSPAELRASRSMAAVPDEVLQHLEFGLIEPNEENLRGQIPFTNVEVTNMHGSAHNGSGGGGPSSAVTRPINRLVYDQRQRNGGGGGRYRDGRTNTPSGGGTSQSVVSENLTVSRRPKPMTPPTWSKDDFHIDANSRQRYLLHLLNYVLERGIHK